MLDFTIADKPEFWCICSQTNIYICQFTNTVNNALIAVVLFLIINCVCLKFVIAL